MALNPWGTYGDPNEVLNRYFSSQGISRTMDNESGGWNYFRQTDDGLQRMLGSPEFDVNMGSLANIGGTDYRRLGDPSAYQNWAGYGTLSPSIQYDPTYGYIAPTDIYNRAAGESYTGGKENFLGISNKGFKLDPFAHALGYEGGLNPTIEHQDVPVILGGALAGAGLAGAAGYGPLAAGAGETGAGGLGGLTAGDWAASGIYGFPEEMTAADWAASGIYGDPVTGGAAGGSVGGNMASGSTALGRLLGLGQTGQDVLSLIGTFGPAVLGYFGAGKQSDAYKDVANQYLNIGAPFRSTLESSYSPGFDLASQPGYGDAFQRMADISARGYSSKFGNPAGSPAAQAGILSDVWNQSYLPALANYRGQLGQFGGLGLNTSGAASLGGAGVAGGQYDAIGLGLGRAFAQPNPYEELARQLADQYRLTV